MKCVWKHRIPSVKRLCKEIGCNRARIALKLFLWFSRNWLGWFIKFFANRRALQHLRYLNDFKYETWFCFCWIAGGAFWSTFLRQIQRGKLSLTSYTWKTARLLVETVTDNRQTWKTGGNVKPRLFAFHVNVMLYLCSIFTCSFEPAHKPPVASLSLGHSCGK